MKPISEYELCSDVETVKYFNVDLVSKITDSWSTYEITLFDGVTLKSHTLEDLIEQALKTIEPTPTHWIWFPNDRCSGGTLIVW